MAHVLIYGGTFDPIHHGHLIVGMRARELLAADLLLLVPARVSPHKVGTGTAPEAPSPAGADDRLAMIRLAIAGVPGVAVDPRELAREGPSYTIDTLRDIAREYSMAGDNAPRFTLLLGADQLAKLHTWRQIAEILTLAEVALAPRPGIDVNGGIKHLCTALGEEAARRVSPVETPEIDISATDIRRRAAAGLPLDFLLPPAVAAYLRQRGIYRNAGQSGVGLRPAVK